MTFSHGWVYSPCPTICTFDVLKDSLKSNYEKWLSRVNGKLQESGKWQKYKYAVAALIVIMVFCGFFFSYIAVVISASSRVVKPSIAPIQPTTGYYLTFRGNTSKIFVVSANVSSGSYPFDTRTSMGIINGKPAGKIAVIKGEPCIVINVTLRNDYSVQNLPPNQITLYYSNGTVAPKSAQVYAFMTAEIFSGTKEINSTDLVHLDLPPDAWSETWMNGGDEGTISIYLAVTSHEEITGFQLDAIWIGELPLA